MAAPFKSRLRQNRMRDSAIASPRRAIKQIVLTSGTDGSSLTRARRYRWVWIDELFQDARENSCKIKCCLVLFRLASFFEHCKKRNILCRLLYMTFNVIYRLYSNLLVGMELPAGTPVGRNLTVHHGYGIVVGRGARLIDDVTLRQGVTIGNYVDRLGRVIGDPVIESGVEFGAGACALGKLRVGAGAFIGANCVVYRDVAPGQRVYPGRPTESAMRDVSRVAREVA